MFWRGTGIRQNIIPLCENLKSVRNADGEGKNIVFD